MDTNRFGQKAHNGTVLRSASGRYDFTDAGSYRVLTIPAIAPPAMILVLMMITVRKQCFQFIMCLVIVEPLAANQGSVKGNIGKNMNRPVHVRVNQTYQFVIARFRECHCKCCPAIQTSRGGDTSAAIIA